MDDKEYMQWIDHISKDKNMGYSIEHSKYNLDKNYMIDATKLYDSVTTKMFTIQNNNEILKNQLRQDYLIDINSMYDEDVDVEALPIKTINDDLVRKNVDYLLIVPQTPERCLLALDVEWSKRVYDMITIPITGDFHKQFLKMKLSKGYLE